MNIALLISALLPAIVLCIYVFKKDRVEKEPIGLLFLLLFLGALSCFPAAFVESVIIGFIDKIFLPMGYVDAEGAVILPEMAFYLYNFLKYFFGVALVEEGFKLLILIWITKKSKEFNCLFDGMIYAIFVSLGFAALENVMYVFDYGFGNAITRAVLSVPAHMFFAVMMGYYYSFWHINNQASKMERILKSENIIRLDTPECEPKENIVLCIVVPVLAHGMYDFCCTIGTVFAFVVFLAFVIFMYIHCFGKIKKMSLNDGYTYNYAKVILLKKYPALQEYINQRF